MRPDGSACSPCTRFGRFSGFGRWPIVQNGDGDSKTQVARRLRPTKSGRCRTASQLWKRKWKKEDADGAASDLNLRGNLLRDLQALPNSSEPMVLGDGNAWRDFRHHIDAAVDELQSPVHQRRESLLHHDSNYF